MRIYDFILTLIGSFILVALVMNASIYSYIEQKYHIEIFSKDEPLLEALSAPKIWLDALRVKLFPSIEDLALSQSLQDEREKKEEREKTTQTMDKDSEKSVWQILMGTNTQESIFAQKEEIRYPFIDKDGKLVLKQDSTFIFIGDSMMQGVGMTLASELKKRGFSVINIAKQSTGLTYTHFFDWGKALKEAFIKNPHINVVVMMVGANDPYAMPKMKYGSDEWVETYSHRIKEIIDTSLEHNAIVVWYAAPYVRKEPLNTRLIFLNTLYQANVLEAKQMLLHSNSALAPEGIYTAYIKNEKGKSVRVRGEDGIHFSGEGSRALSNLLLERLEIIQDEHTNEQGTHPSEQNNNFAKQKPQQINNLTHKSQESSTQIISPKIPTQHKSHKETQESLDSSQIALPQANDTNYLPPSLLSPSQLQNQMLKQDDEAQSKKTRTHKSKKEQSSTQDKIQNQEKQETKQEKIIEKIKDNPKDNATPKDEKRKWKTLFEDKKEHKIIDSTQTKSTQTTNPSQDLDTDSTQTNPLENPTQMLDKDLSQSNNKGI